LKSPIKTIYSGHYDLAKRYETNDRQVTTSMMCLS